jgi:hypothetical protein
MKPKGVRYPRTAPKIMSVLVSKDKRQATFRVNPGTGSINAFLVKANCFFLSGGVKKV